MTVSDSLVQQRARQRWRSGAVFVAVAVVTALIDQLSKIWALNALTDGTEKHLIGSWLSLRLVHNSGAAFSLLADQTWVFTGVAIIVVVFLPFYALRVKHSSSLVLCALALLTGGALGNLIDRLFRAPGFPQGHVVDFIRYGDWFVGNIADIAIVVGAILLAIYAFTSERDGSDGPRLEDGTHIEDRPHPKFSSAQEGAASDSGQRR